MERLFADERKTKHMFRKCLRAIHQDIAEVIKEANLNPNILTRRNITIDEGTTVDRWRLFVLEVEKEFASEGIAPTIDEDNREDMIHTLWNGINKCYTGIQGVSVAKLMHAVVISKDLTYGVNNW